jgi:hypothetical protein
LTSFIREEVAMDTQAETATPSFVYHRIPTNVSRKDTKGIAVSEQTMRAFCTKHGVRPYRPTSQYLKGDPQAQETAAQAIATLKKKPKLTNSSC